MTEQVGSDLNKLWYFVWDWDI